METSKLKKFAQYARRYLIEQVSAKLKFVLAAESAARRENPKAVQDLEKQIQATSQDRVIEKIAYIWFNRFCALRFMDANRYTIIGIVSPAEGQFQPEILADAKMGHIDEAMVPELIRQQVFALLGGSAPSRDPQQEAYSLLLVAVCNYYNPIMPFMFEKIADYTELLMPDDLLSENSILAYTREAMTPDACKDVEVIGWLYQFYISEKKDEVFEGLKKNKKITPENIPAATQLFTPHWIVRYLVENSLGRLWMLNRPNSRLIERMDYYIKPEVPENDFLKISKPEEIRLCDPASGSGHMLTYAFDLFYAIYEEEGYDANEIPRLILENNLFGIEIDERAGELAAFALTMKAREKYKRFLNKPVQPNICMLQNIHFEEGELKRYMDAVGRDLFTANLQTLLHQFRETNNFGSLIRPEYSDAAAILRTVEEKNLTADLFLKHTHERVLLALKQAEYLRPKYHIVITNPPYMGSGGMNGELKVFAQKNYPDSKSDLFAMFIDRNYELTVKHGMVAMITMQSWMFLSSFEKLRAHILNSSTILSMAHLGARAFDSIAGEVVSTTAFVINKTPNDNYKGSYVRLVDGRNETEKQTHFKENLTGGPLYYTAAGSNFKKIPGSPIAYWVKGSSLFEKRTMGKVFISGGRNKTHGNDKYVRYLWEIDSSKETWVPYANGGDYRKYYGNELYVVNWTEEARSFYDSQGGLCNPKFWGKEGITWSLITSLTHSFRIKSDYCQYSSGSPTIFNKEFVCDRVALGLLNSPISRYYLQAINPTINTTVSDVLALPYLPGVDEMTISRNTGNCLSISKIDWDAAELSRDFTAPQLLCEYRQLTIEASYTHLRAHWHEMTSEMRRLEEENNRIFIEAYGLQDELKPDVLLNEITLTCNPHYRYGNDKSKDELEALLLADTMKEFISYAVGCMFGRYSLDKAGLILANQGESLQDYIAKVPNPTFESDEDNVIPILDEGWFIDDITERFSKFLRVTFSEEHYEENLAFIEEAIGKDIRKYFLKDFYSDHLKRFKKRPIYWLFSSPKGSFNALIYMHHYRPDTVSVVLNDYLREFRAKLSARKGNLEQISISASASQREKTQALKEIEKLRKMIEELEEYERDIMYPLATKQINIDLDDGVKVNYLKFGDALKKIPGLEAKGED